MAKILRFEIHATDPPRLAAYYRELFGWTFVTGPVPGYWPLRRDARAGVDPGLPGGIVQRMGPAPDSNGPVSSFICTVEVDDVDAVMAHAMALGGVLALPKMAIPRVGWLGYVRDCDGNLIGLSSVDATAS